MLRRYAAGSKAGSGAFGRGTSGTGLSVFAIEAPLVDFGKAGDFREPFEWLDCASLGEIAGLELLRVKRPMSSKGTGCG